MTDRGPTYDVYNAIGYLRPLGRMPRWLTWAIGPAVFAVAVGVSAVQHTFSFSGGPDLNDLGALIGVSTSNFKHPELPLARDWCSMILIVTLGLSSVCARYQWDALKTCLRRLDDNDAWSWPKAKWTNTRG